jgi:very-short-patch-repair endonuclease
MRIPVEVQQAAEMQKNVVSRRQLLDVGVSRNLIEERREDASWPRLKPLRTNVEETVLDLIQECRTFDDVCGWVTAAFRKAGVNAHFLGAAARQRKKMRWRAEFEEIIAAGDKVHSPLEFRYLRDVERAHGLPAAKRQVQVRIDGKKAYRDVYYEEFQVVVELDGKTAHPPEQHWQDIRRDAVTSAEGIMTVRYGWQEVRGHPCETAVLQARILRQHGWTGQPTPCSRDCPAGSLTSQPVLVGEHDELRAVAGTDLGHGPADVGLSGQRAHHQLAADLFVRQPGRHQRHHLTLAFSERIDR